MNIDAKKKTKHANFVIQNDDLQIANTAKDGVIRNFMTMMTFGACTTNTQPLQYLRKH